MKNYIYALLILNLFLSNLLVINADGINYKTVTGELTVLKDEKAKTERGILAVESIDDNDNEIHIKYEIMLDKIGKELVKTANGKIITVTGIIRTRGLGLNTRRLIQVKEYKIVKN